MFWGYKVLSQVKNRFAPKISSGQDIIIRDEWSASGPAHTGSLRGIVIHGLIADLLSQESIHHNYLFEINDFDPLDGLPTELDAKKFKPYLGQLLCNVPSPDDSTINFAEYWAQSFTEVVKRTGYHPEFYRSSELYFAGKYNTVIREALDHADEIRQSYKEVAGSDKSSDWYPLQVVCTGCGKIGTTKVIDWNGKLVTYECQETLVSWAVGCGVTGDVDPFDGRSKLPWKVEWPAKFKALGVDIEGAGKDHNTKGGSRDIARVLLKNVFHYPEPLNIPYDFFTIDGKKMSSSKGLGVTAFEVTDVLPMDIVRLLNMKEPKKPIEFNLRGDTVPILYDTLDLLADNNFKRDNPEHENYFPFLYPKTARNKLQPIFRPRFRELAYLVQMPHIDIEKKVALMKGSKLDQADKEELSRRADYAKRWLDTYSPDSYKFVVQKTTPLVTKSFNVKQKAALAEIISYMLEQQVIDGSELHTKIHDIKKEIDIPAKELFSAIYMSFLGKDSGPQAGWFLSALDRDFVIKRLKDVSE